MRLCTKNKTSSKFKISQLLICTVCGSDLLLHNKEVGKVSPFFSWSVHMCINAHSCISLKKIGQVIQRGILLPARLFCTCCLLHSSSLPRSHPLALSQSPSLILHHGEEEVAEELSTEAVLASQAAVAGQRMMRPTAVGGSQR